jgi:hypothetical protein
LTEGLTAFLFFTDLTFEGFAGVGVPLEAAPKLEPSEVAGCRWA